jgi:hypothetical protein
MMLASNDQSLADSLEAQRNQLINMATSMTASVRSGAGAEFARFARGINRFAGGKDSAISDASIGAMMNNVAPFVSMYGGQLGDVMFGNSAFGLAAGLAPTQRAYFGDNMSTAQARQAGTQLGNTMSDIFGLLKGPTNNPLQNTAGFGSSESAAIAIAAQRTGLGGLGKLTGAPTSNAQAASFISSSTSQARAVQELGGRFANLSGAEAMAAVPELTLGGTGMTGNQRAMHIAEMKQLSRVADMSPETIVGLQIQAAERAKQLGGDYRTGRGAGLGAAAESAYYKDNVSESALTDMRTSRAELTQQSAMLRVQGVNSTAGGQMAALAHAGQHSLLDRGSPGARAYAQLQKGDYKYMNESEFTGMLEHSGMGRQEAQYLRLNHDQNVREHGNDKGVEESVRRGQWDTDIAPRMSRAIEGRLASLTHGHAQKGLGAKLTAAIKASGGKTEAEERANVIKELRKAGYNERDARHHADSVIGAADYSVNPSGSGEMTALHMATLNSDEALAGSGAVRKKADAAAKSAIAQQGSGRESAALRVHDAAVDVGAGGDPKDAALKALNIRPKSAVDGKTTTGAAAGINAGGAADSKTGTRAAPIAVNVIGGRVGLADDMVPHCDVGGSQHFGVTAGLPT